ncbi:uncharacterized protein LOC124274487 [Haliotis rubra]|uniref:uncharacterized protein LOC124274487 n=1 Tax=Haliotis rubra TaxID=36100 RepID=UPI001EE57C56|nr:uncharacterized protein LOC124274487 [Haliotis rubra]XP_046565816.1 uncharacterized protein LOC124274487 [Haliotis rubra]
MALAILPAAHIRPVFRQLKMRASSQKLVDLCDYMERQWMSHSIFTVVSWCVFNQSVRTNNNVEGWHRRMNVQTSDQQLGLYKLIQLSIKKPVSCRSTPSSSMMENSQDL